MESFSEKQSTETQQQLSDDIVAATTAFSPPGVSSPKDIVDTPVGHDTSQIPDDGIVRSIVVDASADNAAGALVVSEKKRKFVITDDDNAQRVLKCKRLRDDALLPKRATTGAAGYDLHAVEAAIVPARGRADVFTGVALAIPPGYYGRVAPRSSLARKGIDVGAGVVDADYRGEIKIILYNHDDTDYEIKPEDRVAQLILERIVTPETQWVDDLDGTDRGDGGFGSTGR